MFTTSFDGKVNENKQANTKKYVFYSLLIKGITKSFSRDNISSIMHN